MVKILSENLISIIKDRFPKFIPYWNSFVESFGLDEGITIQMIPFSLYAIDVIKENNKLEIKQIFDFVEFLLVHGDDLTQTAITTSFLEHLLAKDPAEIKFADFVDLMGRNAIEYCKAWDEFTGIRTKGLWEN